MNNEISKEELYDALKAQVEADMDKIGISREDKRKVFVEFTEEEMDRMLAGEYSWIEEALKNEKI